MTSTTIQITDSDGELTDEGRDFFKRFQPSNLEHIVERPLREYQDKAVEACTQALSEHDRASLVMACGTGKTLTTAAILGCFCGKRDAQEWILLSDAEREATSAEDFFSNTALVLVPSLALAAQTWQELSKTIPAEFAIFGSSGPGERGVEGDLDVLVTTDPEELTFWHQPLMGRRVVISTYHSAPRLAQAQAGFWVDSGDLDIGVIFNRIPTFSIVIADEAHKISGKTDESDWAIALGDRLKIRKRLFATATPTSGENAMDNEDLFGPRAYTYDMRTAINEGHLSDFRMVAIGVKANGGQGDLLHAIRLAAAEYGLARIASFHSNLADAKYSAAAINDSGVGTADFLSGSHTWEERHQMLNRLRDAKGLHVLTSVNTISEGVNVPTLDGVVFAAPKSSPVQVTQITGRAIRKNPLREEPAIILVPVYVAEDEDEDQRLDEAKFSDVRKIVQALQDHDPTFISRLGRDRYGQTGPGGEAGGPESSPLSVLDTTGTLDLSSFYTRVLEESLGIEGRWWSNLSAVRRFLEESGWRWPSQEAQDPEEYRLAVWVYSQRAAYASQSNLRTTSPDRKQALDETLPGWGDMRADRQWMENLDGLVAFVLTERNWPSRRAARSHTEERLARFLHNQRSKLNSGKLRGDRKSLLDAHVPHWDEKTYWDFVRMIDEIEEFHNSELRPPKRSGKEGRYGNWLYQRRSGRVKERGHRIEMMDERIPWWRTL